MPIYLAEKTIIKIEEKIREDQGAKFRSWLGKIIPHIGDAYRENDFPFRTHLGASGIGGSCARKIWYGFRWSSVPTFDGRILRLFNRGHLEEARFIAMLLTIGVEIFQQDTNGNQFRISDAGGHFGGSGDGVGIGIPDVDPDMAVLLEFKTSAEKPFLELVKKGVREAKFEHYVQTQCYMDKMGLGAALYLVVNKNNDELYGEIIPYDQAVANEFINRGVALVWSETPPAKISETPGWFECRFCDFKSICHRKEAPSVNCRTCSYSKPTENGNWICINEDSNTPSGPLTKEDQFKGCLKYERKF